MSTKPAVNQAVVIAFRDAAEFEAWLERMQVMRAGTKLVPASGQHRLLERMT